MILLVVSVISFNNGGKVRETSDLVNHTQEIVYELDQIILASVNAETGTRGYIITGNENFLEPYDNARALSSRHLSRAIELTQGNVTQQSMLEKLNDLVSKHFEYLQKCQDIRKKSLEETSDLVSTSVGKRLLDEIRNTVAAAKDIQQRLLIQRKAASARDTETFERLFILLVGLIIVALTIIYLLIMVNIRALRKAEAESASKNWSLSGSRELISGMQGNINSLQLGQAIIDHLTNYLQLPIGAIYIAENNALRMLASHAIELGANEQKWIAFGEGLAGQAAAEKKTIFLHELTGNNFDIVTSFGRVKPQEVMGMPILYQESVVAVVELGSLLNFSVAQVQYLEFVSSSIAISLISSQAREEARELFEETQRQAEELESQQTELKQTNEDLHSKTLMLEKSQSELQAQQTELELVNTELEEKAMMLQEQKEVVESSKREIELKANQIEVTSKYKSEFLANMSHELRTPLNSILILSQLLSENKNGSLNNKDIEYANNIHNSGTDLLNLINEILDLSKIESGKMQLDVSETAVKHIIETIDITFKPVAEKNSISFSINCQNDVKETIVFTDKQRVEQILKNLLANAFKFTAAKGKVNLSIGRAAQHILSKDQNADVLYFAVSDTGIGIAKNKLEIIFEAFQQADGSTKRKYGGTGLGLSISRELSLALGGRIGIESEEGKGSTFTFYLPETFHPHETGELRVSPRKTKFETQVTEKSHMITEALPDWENYSDDDRNNIKESDKVILIVEDEPQFAHVLLGFIRERNYRGIIATQGNMGISYARHFKPDAIFLDINLPVMNGMEVLRIIKADPDLRHTPVQIISAYDEKRKGLEMGAFNFISKPVSSNDLQKALDRIESFKNQKLKKLLIVEDNKTQNDAIRELIGNGDVKCFSAFEGNNAYKMLQQEKFDCLVVDLGLPDISGFDLLKKIKSNDELNAIPIIVYTGRELKNEEIKLLNKLADSIVLKTASSHERLLDETTLFLHRVESRLPKAKQNIIRKLHKSDELLKDKRILLVDDDIRNIYAITNALEDEGVQCITAENGKVALEILNDQQGVDLVLMDIMMPELDGYETTAEIRKSESLKKIPIIALTAKAMKGDKEKCLAAGMSDYISKPVNIEQLKSLLRVWLYK